jgi:intracellular sulfur oxidation DsrE/DsrF family protein
MAIDVGWQQILRQGLGMLLLVLAVSTAHAHEKIQQILAMPEEPPGVVIEIVTGDDDGLGVLMPKVQEWVQRLNTRFPDMPVAVVTHGREQFALQTRAQDSDPQVHSISKQLNAQGVSVHVCGTYAGWEGLSDEDFPEYVDVAAAGPAQINDYRSLGFILVKLTEAP